MKVWELISILSEFNPNDEIFILQARNAEDLNEVRLTEEHIQHDNADGVLFNGVQ